MSEVMHVCQVCPRPLDTEYEDYKDQLGHMRSMEYVCPKCGICRCCGGDGSITIRGELYLTGGSD